MSDVRLHGERRFAEAIVATVRLLRRAGLPLGAGESLIALKAVTLIGASSRAEIEVALASVLVKRVEHLPLFRLVFDACWGLTAPMLPVEDEQRAQPVPDAPPPGLQRLLEAMSLDVPRAEKDRETTDVDAQGTMSDRERLRRKDIAQMTTAETRRARALLAEAWRLAADVPTRRFAVSTHPAKIDMRSVLARSRRHGGEYMTLPYQKPRRRPPHVVTLIDISGSMSQYTRVYLHFAFLLEQRYRGAETFVFGTRLSRVTRALAGRDPDVAMKRCAATAEDWDGGTRISAALRSFNLLWSRRVLSRPAVVLLLTDGLERDQGADLSQQAAALARRARQLIWLNPLLRFDGFTPRAGGIRALLPHVDAMVAGHSVRSLSEVVGLIAKSGETAVKSSIHVGGYDGRPQFVQEAIHVGTKQR